MMPLTVFILKEYDMFFETDESMCALLTKLHEYYGSHIQPPDAGDRIKTILLSTGGFIKLLILAWTSSIMGIHAKFVSSH